MECSLLEKREKWQEKFAAFRLVVGFDDKDKIFDADIWPHGSDVRDWVFTNRRRDGN